MSRLRALAVTLLLVSHASVFGQRQASQTEANKKVVHDFYRYVWEPQDVNALPKFVGGNYIEHNPLFNGGRDALAREMKAGRFRRRTSKVEDKLTDPPEFITAEGDLVTWIFKRTRPDPNDSSKTYESFWFDTFRVKDGKIVEHWDAATRQRNL